MYFSFKLTWVYFPTRLNELGWHASVALKLKKPKQDEYRLQGTWNFLNRFNFFTQMTGKLW